jgi:putative endonuclease
MKTYWVYIPTSRPRGTLNVGMTNDLVRRVCQHREGLVDGFSREYEVKMLVYYEQHATALAAIRREENIKHWSRAWKIELIRPAQSRLARFMERRRPLSLFASVADSQHGPPGQARW